MAPSGLKPDSDLTLPHMDMLAEIISYPSRHGLRGDEKREPGNDDEDGGADIGLHHVVGKLAGQVELE